MVRFALKDLIEVGYIFKTVGTKGELVISLAGGIVDENSKNLKYVFIEHGGQAVPYFVNYCDDQLISLEGIDTPEQAILLCSKRILLDKAFLTGTKIYNGTGKMPIHGFILKNGDKTYGKIADIVEMPGQVLISLQDFPSAMIPLVDEWITEINIEEMYVDLDFDEDLLSLNV